MQDSNHRRSIAAASVRAGETYSEAARAAGVSARTIKRWAQRYGWSHGVAAGTRLPQAVVDVVQRMWGSEAYSVAEIERQTDVSETTQRRLAELFAWGEKAVKQRLPIEACEALWVSDIPMSELERKTGWSHTTLRKAAKTNGWAARRSVRTGKDDDAQRGSVE